MKIHKNRDLSTFILCQLQIGESAESYCYAGSAKKGHDSKFEDYGETFAKGDVVGAFLDMVGTKITMTFTKNGETQGKNIKNTISLTES